MRRLLVSGMARQWIMAELKKFRIIVLFGSIPLYGQERGNIEAMRALKESDAAEVLFVTHKQWGHQVIHPELDRLGLPWTVACYARRFSKEMGVVQWLQNFRDMCIGSWQLSRIVRRFRPTHFHVGNPAFFLNFLPYLLFSRLPLVYRVGDQPSLHNRAYRCLWRCLIVPRVTQFVANSNFIQQSLFTVPVSPDKVSLIYSRPANILNVNVADYVLLYTDVPIIFYAGQISKDKGVDLLVSAARKILLHYPETTFLFAGDYSWRNPFAEELMEGIRRDGLEKKIVFLGYREDISTLLAKTGLHVCPSVWEEALPNVVLEAKNCGKPSIVFPSGGLPELIRHGVDGYICPEKNSDSLAAAIEYYLMDPDKMVEHGKAAYNSLEEVFEMSKFADKWVQVYEDAKR
jgi:glycosyltransferase involved in cell wall biosynthesis